MGNQGSNPDTRGNCRVMRLNARNPTTCGKLDSVHVCHLATPGTAAAAPPGYLRTRLNRIENRWIRVVPGVSDPLSLYTATSTLPPESPVASSSSWIVPTEPKVPAVNELNCCG